MNNSVKDSLIPVLSVMAGVAVTVVCARWMERLKKPDPEVQVAIDKFDQMEPSRQDRLLTQAAGFESQDARYQDRIISIHKAVTDDPSLESKLRTLHNWWRPLDATQEAKIRSFDGDSAEWVRKVQRAYVESHPADHVITVWVPGPPLPNGEWRFVKLTESQFEPFLNSILPKDVPSELASKLSGFEPDERCEIILTKIIWVMDQMLNSSGPPGRSPQQKGEPRELFDSIRIADMQKLFDAEDWKLLSEAAFKSRNDDGTDGNEDARRRQAGILIASGLSHYARVFWQKHLGDQRSSLSTLLQNDDDLVDVFENHIDRSKQLTLMKIDPSHAAELLELERERVNTQDSAVAGLINDLNEKLRSFRGRGGMQRGPSYGGRSGFSRPSGEDNRSGRDENRGGGRSGVGRPSREGRLEFQ